MTEENTNDTFLADSTGDKFRAETSIFNTLVNLHVSCYKTYRCGEYVVNNKHLTDTAQQIIINTTE